MRVTQTEGFNKQSEKELTLDSCLLDMKWYANGGEGNRKNGKWQLASLVTLSALIDNFIFIMILGGFGQSEILVYFKVKLDCTPDFGVWSFEELLNPVNRPRLGGASKSDF